MATDDKKTETPKVAEKKAEAPAKETKAEPKERPDYTDEEVLPRLKALNSHTADSVYGTCRAQEMTRRQSLRRAYEVLGKAPSKKDAE
jgi:hypothetical protein